jgi:hypothetical protein
MTRVVKVTDKSPRLTVQEFSDSPNDDCRCMVLTSQMVTVIRAALWPYFTWPTRFGEWVRPGIFSLADKAIYDELQDVLAELDYKLTGDEMANCFEALSGPIDHIASALASLKGSGVCCGDGGCCEGVEGWGPYVGYTDDGTPIIGGETFSTTVDGEGDPPEGFDSWEEYYTHKCQVANWLVDAAITELYQISTVSAIEKIAVSIALGAILTFYVGSIPGALLGALVGAVLALNVAEVAIEDIADYMTTHREEYVCALYNSETAEVAINEVGSKIDETLEALALAANVHWAVKLIAAFLFSTDAVNKLFDYGMTVYYPDADCSGCSDLCNGDVDKWGTIANPSQFNLSGSAAEDVEAEMVTPDPSYHHRFDFIFTPVDDYCSFILDSIASTDWTGGYVVIYDASGSVITEYGAGSITGANYEAANAYFATHDVYVRSGGGSYFTNAGTVTLTFRED